MKRLPVLIVTTSSWILGCHKQPESLISQPNSKSQQVEDAPPSSHENLRSGTIQLYSASDRIQEALEYVTQNNSLGVFKKRHAYTELVKSLDGAGRAIADYIFNPPTQKKCEEDRTYLDQYRKKATQAANDAYQELTQADGIIEVLLESANDSEKEILVKLVNLIDEASKELEGAIRGFGGILEEDP